MTTAEKNAVKEAEQQEKTIEQAFTELDILAERLEDRETSLEESFLLFKKRDGIVEILQR